MLAHPALRDVPWVLDSARYDDKGPDKPNVDALQAPRREVEDGDGLAVRHLQALAHDPRHKETILAVGTLRAPPQATRPDLAGVRSSALITHGVLWCAHP